MTKYYPSILDAEKKRMNALVWSFLIALIAGLSVGFFLNNIYGLVLGVIVCGVCFIQLSKVTYSRLKVSCPICNSDELRENYANSPRYSDKDVEHKCNNCGSFFIEGKHIENEST